jgi:hypothetical protein
MTSSPTRYNLIFWIVLLLGAAWLVYLGSQSRGTPLHDEISHYLISRAAWSDPLYILDVWGRPGNTLFYLLPSAISVGARRWWALAACILIALITARTAAKLGLRHLWLVPLAFWLQPWVVQLGYTSITQIPFMLALTLGIDQWVSGRRGWASLCFGMLPLIRHEGLALTLVWAGFLVIEWLLRRKDLRLPLLPIFIAALPMLVWNVLFLLAYGRFASGNLVNLRPTDIYGSGDWLHFVMPMFASVGLVILIFSGLGLFRLARERRSALIYILPAVLYFITHTLIYRYGLFASGGYVLFLLPMAPTYALLAALAGECVPDWIERLEGRWLQGQRRRFVKLAAVGVLFGAALLYAGVTVAAVRPWLRQPNEVAMEEAAQWFVDQNTLDAPVYSSHVWFWWVYTGSGLMRIPDGGLGLTADDVPMGSYWLWDRNYGDLNAIALEALRAPHSGFVEIARFANDEGVLFRRE